VAEEPKRAVRANPGGWRAGWVATRPALGFGRGVVEKRFRAGRDGWEAAMDWVLPPSQVGGSPITSTETTYPAVDGIAAVPVWTPLY
jgi:hypothetical protein